MRYNEMPARSFFLLLIRKMISGDRHVSTLLISLRRNKDFFSSLGLSLDIFWYKKRDERRIGGGEESIRAWSLVRMH